VELNGPAVSTLAMWLRKLSNILKVPKSSKFIISSFLAWEGMLSRWSQLHLQSLAPAPVSSRVDIRQADGGKNNFRIFITTLWKHVVSTLLSGIRVGRRKRNVNAYAMVRTYPWVVWALTEAPLSSRNLTIFAWP
jgi:hypothetical protein